MYMREQIRILTKGICRRAAALAVILSAIAFVASAPAFAGPARVELSVSPSGVIGQGDMFQIYITVKNIEGEPSAPSKVPGASVKYFGHRSSSSSFVSTNGHTSQSVTNVYALTLKAEKKGKYTFGPISVEGIKSNKVSYTIGDATQRGPQPGDRNATQQNSRQDPTASQGAANGPTFIGKGNEQLFLRANVSKTTAYEQEALVYTVKLYTTYNSIKFIGATDAPKFDGFVIEESSNISDHLTLETYQGKSYATAVIARYIIFPQMSGKLKIKGNKYTVSADAEEYYHDPFWSQLTVRRPVQLHVTPNDLTIDVRALPTPRPANFSGGVGKFSISSSLPSSRAVAHQAASVTYTVTGQGNLKYITLPDLNSIYPPELEVFSPTTDVKTDVGSTNVSGSVKFDYSFMPQEQGNFHIPDVQLVYFNPVSGKYETATAHGFDLNVSRGAESEKSQSAIAFSPALMSVDGKLMREYRPYVYRPLYWLLFFLLPLSLLIAAMIVYRKHLQERADLIALRSRQAAKMARRKLKAAEACMDQKNTVQFYNEMLKAIWGYLGDKLKIPTSELNRANVEANLEKAGIDRDLRQRVIGLVDDCEFSKYSQEKANDDMKPVYDEGVGVLNDLEDAFKRLRKAGPRMSLPVGDTISSLDNLNPEK